MVGTPVKKSDTYFSVSTNYCIIYRFITYLSFHFQIQVLKVLVNVSSNPDMMDDIVEAQVRQCIQPHCSTPQEPPRSLSGSVVFGGLF